MDLFADLQPSLPFQLPEGVNASARWDPDLHGFWISVPHGELFYAQAFVPQSISDRTLAYFLENKQGLPVSTDWANLPHDTLAAVDFSNIAWKQDFIQLYGKRIPLPRLTSWYGDAGKSYTYSGIQSQPHAWNKGLSYLKARVEAVAGASFNSVLLNWYRSGEDHLSWHADDEKELGHDPMIASLNFGETRDFVLRLNDDHSIKICIPLIHGTLLLMRGALQHHWQHSVPKRKKVQRTRFNLTFRRIDMLS